ncbi:MAG: ribosome biogenesis GTPase Der [Deferribacterota bacterium]|nr:ribosome biogenesis GTPase Der [Deferribacterota bacterium]
MDSILIAGRPNVGKSALFNRLVGKTISIVDKTPNVTRDCVERVINLNEKKYLLSDSAGFVLSRDPLRDKIDKIYIDKLKKASLVLFVVDGKEGLHPLDEHIFTILRKNMKKTLVVVNKIDNIKEESSKAEFYALGVSDLITVSAVHGKNIDTLIHKISECLDRYDTEIGDYNSDIKIVVLGKPNVGKSSYLNALLGEQRVVVSDMPGTTRDIVNIPFKYKNSNLTLIDTAGLRKKSVMFSDNIDRISYYRVFEAVKSADVVIYLFDGVEGIQSKDVNIIGQIYNNYKKPVVLSANKWDLVKNKDGKKHEIYNEVNLKLSFLYKPYISFISTLKKEGIFYPIKDVLKVVSLCNRDIKTSKLNEVLHMAGYNYQAPIVNGKRIKFYYTVKLKGGSPRFLMFVNYPSLLKESYKQYLVNVLKKTFNYRGIPVEIILKQRRERRLKAGVK